MRLNENPTSKAPPDRSLMDRPPSSTAPQQDSCRRRVKRNLEANLEAVVKPVINCRLDSVFGQIHELQYVTKKNGGTVQEKKIPSSVNRTIINWRHKGRSVRGTTQHSAILDGSALTSHRGASLE